MKSDVKTYFDEEDIDEGKTWIELATTEVEGLLREHPEAAQKIIQKYLNAEISWEDFSTTERGVLLQALIESKANTFSETESIAVKALQQEDFVRTPPTPEEFLDDSQYLGPIKDTIYPYWREQLLIALNPKNQIFEMIFQGSAGSGKCVAKDSYIFSSEGLLTIEELYNKRNYKNQVLSESGIRQIEHYHDEGLTETIKLNTHHGFDLECRPNHRIRILENNKIVWKESKDIKEHDVVLISRQNNVWGSNPFNISKEEAELFGCIIGDGYIRESSIEISFGADDQGSKYRDHISNLLISLKIPFRSYTRTRKDTGTTLHTLGIYNRNIINKIISLGVCGRSHTKVVPLCIRQGTKEVVSAFLNGLYSTDGSISKKGFSIELGLSSKELIRQVQQLLLNFGIVSRRVFKKNNYKGSHRLNIIGRKSKELFNENVKFNYEKKQQLLEEYLNYQFKTNRHNDHDKIPVHWTEIDKIKEAVRWKRLGLKQNTEIFTCRDKKGKTSFTYRALDKFVKVFGEGYLTPTLKDIYNSKYLFSEVTAIEKSFTHCYDLTVENDPSYISNGFISHNTRCAIISQLYKLAWLSCLRDLPGYYGLDKATKIAFGLFTLSLTKADNALSSDFRKIISMSPYFRNVFPLKKRNAEFKKVLNTMGDNSENYEVLLPQGLYLLLGSKLQHALSLNVISGILDEMNFRQKRTIKEDDDEDSASSLYTEISSRIRNRFNRLGHVPGLLCVISSKKAHTDFLEAHIEAKKNDPHVLIVGGSQWDIKPGNYRKERFHLFLGSSKTSSRILEPWEVELYPKDSPNVLSVPVDLRPEFEYDINAALRNLAGISTSGVNLLFEDPLKITGVWNKERIHPFLSEEIEIGLKTRKNIKDYLIWDELFRDAGFAVLPKNHPEMLRVLHIDLSKSNDITGISMGGIVNVKEYIGKDVEGTSNVRSFAPEIWIDFALGIRAPQGDQIDYQKIHDFIVFLRASRFNIRYVTFDSFQSVSSIQMLIKAGFETSNLSVDRNDLPYIMLRDSIINKNIDIYPHKKLETELVNLQHKYVAGRAKVDHPPNKSKDIADSLAGVVSTCHEMLTNTKKFPDTANIAYSKTALSALYPTPVDYSTEFSNKDNNEFQSFDKNLFLR